MVIVVPLRLSTSRRAQKLCSICPRGSSRKGGLFAAPSCNRLEYGKSVCAESRLHWLLPTEFPGMSEPCGPDRRHRPTPLGPPPEQRTAESPANNCTQIPQKPNLKNTASVDESHSTALPLPLAGLPVADIHPTVDNKPVVECADCNKDSLP